jgi:predicted phosphodiesterase
MKNNTTFHHIIGLYAVCAAVLFTACSDESTLDIKGMFSPQGETVNTRFAQSMAYNDSVGEIHLDMKADEYTVFVCSDSHVTRQRHKLLAHFVKTYEAAVGPKLAIHLGDLIDAQKNFPCADSVLRLGGRSITDTLFLTPGNHDIYFKQWPIYRSFFKTGTYWFDTNNGSKKLDLFICLDSAEATMGTDQTRWLRDLLSAKSKEGYRRIIVFTHTHFWKLDTSQGYCSNYALEETYELASLFAQYGVEYVWAGHQHAQQSVLYKGVKYLVLDSTKDTENGQSYMTATLGPSAIYHYTDYPKE